MNADKRFCVICVYLRSSAAIFGFGLIFLLPIDALHGETGSEVCATCHREIAETYRKTGMARSSGAVTGIEIEGSFAHKPSGVEYRVYRQDSAAWFSFNASGVQGRRRLEYFIGSGAVGRSYLYTVDGFLYQAPVSWYSAPAKWDLSPGYQQYDRLYLTRGVETVCLDCHASRLQPVAGTANGYRSPPFHEGGVSCERCHGAGEAHVAGRGKTIDAAINPAKLAPDRRDSICAQCHLAGEARIARAGADGRFHPGDRLADSVVVFEWSGKPDMNVTSHFETLAESACKRVSGDRLWCGSCHDPHRAPAESEKASFYRAKCLACHQTAECSRGPDCAGCHMPKRPVRDVQHSAYTDHDIRKPGAATGALTAASGRKLVPFGGVEAGDREIGLAYAAVPGFEKQAREYLERAPQDDAEVLAHLAYLYESNGDLSKAAPLYQKALKLDPSQVAAAVNLGNLFIKGGQAREAIRLWQYALEKSPGLETVRLSLAVAQYRSGDSAAAEGSLTKLLGLNPANTVARRLLSEVRSRR
ncbi:MAG: tetratricopeptide repeat protein [Bryobacteraceae bacterium]